MDYNLSAAEKLKAHCDLCEECKRNLFGLCKRGFDLLGEAAMMRYKGDEDQAELFPEMVTGRPIPRMLIDLVKRRYTNKNQNNK